MSVKQNCAYCNDYGRIYLRIVSLGDGFELRAVDHGLTIEDAQCIAFELTAAIHKAAMIATGRLDRPNSKEDRP